MPSARDGAGHFPRRSQNTKSRLRGEDARRSGGLEMAKGQMRTNKEKRKPKKNADEKKAAKK
jgi:hypothetical protein